MSKRFALLVSVAQALQAAVHRHPRRISAAVLLMLTGSAMTAFGVSPLSALPSVPQPVISQIHETPAMPELSTELASLGDQPLVLFRNDVTR